MNNELIKKCLSMTRFVGRLLARLPSVRCVILNGSLAQGKSKKSSDIDILIIAKTDRIFSARFFVNAFATLLRIKRSKDETKNHSGKFCFNYFLTEDFLTIPTGRGEKIDSYCAENYSASKFIAGDVDLFNKFILINQELFNKYGFKAASQKLQVTNNHSHILQNIGMLLFSRRFENWAKNYQIKKIESDPRTNKYPNLIVYNDRELRFHPPKK